MERKALSFSDAVKVVTFVVLFVSATVAWTASTEKILHNFGGPGDGYFPSSSLVFNQAGNAYGTTGFGGAGRGAVYQLVPNSDGSWTESVICLFETGGPNGPEGPLIFDNLGNLYGDAGSDNNLGTIFKLTPSTNGSWSESTIHYFTGGLDGADPSGLGFNVGKVYGVAFSGGVNDGGVAFRLGQLSVFTWYEIVLHPFGAGQDGLGPNGKLTFDASGNIYGVTQSGGAHRSGTVFKLTPNVGRVGWTESVLYEFGAGGDLDGVGPLGGVIFDSIGNLYGTTEYGGLSNWGTVFKLTPQPQGVWTETLIHQFSSPDGRNPVGQLTFDQTGNIYGTTAFGGSDDWGTVFKLAPQLNGTWTEDILYSFTNGLDGGEPSAGVVVDGFGNVYGTAENGGTNQCTGLLHGCGVVYEITP